MRILAPLAVAATLVLPPLAAQDAGHEHVAGMVHPTDAAVSPPVSPGQAAFGAIAEIIARLDADPATDWSTVDIERLRRHLIDMDLVTLRSRIATTEVAGGVEATLTGDAETSAAIRAMLTAHAAAMAGDPAMRASVVEVPGGARLTVVARDASDARAVARLRGLGAIGFLALGGHHAAHHEALARGADPHAGH